MRVVEIAALICTMCAGIRSSQSSEGKFWHISDLHLDFYYDSRLSPDRTCPSSSGVAAINAGPWGDYRCDSPLKLIKSAIDAMVEIEDSPDFVFWTGDDVLHTHEEENYLSENLVLQVISNLTNLVQQAFPNTTVFSALGNHDYYLKNQFPAAPNNIVSSVANLWRSWLTDEQYQQFNITGYYSGKMVNFPKLHVIVLNTNIWYYTNRQVNGTGDPDNHFKWLEAKLIEIQQNEEKAFIIGHIPPGYYDLSFDVRWYDEYYNEKYISVIEKYHDVILGQFFGHHHTDNFRMFYDSTGKAVSSLLLAPAITPWISSYLDTSGNNPGIRLFEFDKTSLLLKDYVQYYLNLTKANELNVANWEIEYRATEAYEIPNLSTESLQVLSEKLKNVDVSCVDCEENKLLQKFNLHTSVYFNKEYCGVDCHKRQVCAITNLGTKGYGNCVAGSSEKLKSKLVGFHIGVVLSFMYALF